MIGNSFLQREDRVLFNNPIEMVPLVKSLMESAAVASLKSHQ
jgi:hypothetical protein